MPHEIGIKPTVQRVVALKECRHGKMLFLERDLYMGRSLALYGEYSEIESDVFNQILRPGDIVIEVGANIGAHTLSIAKKVGPTGLVLAFEPQRVIFQLLCANVVMNEQFHVHTYHAAVGREHGTIKVPPCDYTAAENFGAIALGSATAGEEVPVIALDRKFDLPSLRLLKADVEGMESDVIEGARGLIARHRPILYVENDRKEKSEALISLIADLGYAMWWHAPPYFNPDNFSGNPENVFPSTVSLNLLCLPKEQKAEIRNMPAVTGPKDWFQDKI